MSQCSWGFHAVCARLTNRMILLFIVLFQVSPVLRVTLHGMSWNVPWLSQANWVFAVFPRMHGFCGSSTECFFGFCLIPHMDSYSIGSFPQTLFPHHCLCNDLVRIQSPQGLDPYFPCHKSCDSTWVMVRLQRIFPETGLLVLPLHKLLMPSRRNVLL